MLSDEASPVRQFTPAGADIDSVLDVKAVFQQEHHGVDVSKVSKLFLPASGPLGLTDYEKIYAAHPGEETDIFDLRSVSRDGAVVIVRPDQYVSAVLPLDAPELVAEFFAGILTPQV